MPLWGNKNGGGINHLKHISNVVVLKSPLKWECKLFLLMFIRPAWDVVRLNMRESSTFLRSLYHIFCFSWELQLICILRLNLREFLTSCLENSQFLRWAYSDLANCCSQLCSWKIFHIYILDIPRLLFDASHYLRPLSRTPNFL